MSSPEGLSIGILSERSGVKVETIRYYERTGLMKKPGRNGAGHRVYRRDDVARLGFIRRSRNLGFSLEEIRHLLDLADQSPRSCRHAHAVGAARLAEVRARIRDLRQMENALADLVAACDGGAMPTCPLLEALGRPEREHAGGQDREP